MIVECPHCFNEFDAPTNHEPDTGFYCPDCGTGFAVGNRGVS